VKTQDLIEQALDETPGFAKRQGLLKQLWKLQQDGDPENGSQQRATGVAERSGTESEQQPTAT
jgi:hypothetical protein